MRIVIKIFCCLYILLSMVSCATMESSPLPPAPQQPNLTVTEPEYDFGIAGPGEKITHTFTLTNTGAMPLLINKVETSCGCTAALISNNEIPAGGAGAVKTIFETQDFEGQQEKIITVYSNDPVHPEFDLTIKGIIKHDVAVVPQGIHFGDIEKGATPSGRVRLLQLSSDTVVVVEKIEANQEYLSVSMSRFKEENSRGINIDVVLRPGIPVGQVTEVITLHTNLKNRPRIDVPIWANILGRLAVQPKALAFGAVSKGKDLSQAITVSSRDDTAFKVLAVTSDVPFIHLKTSTGEKTNVVTITGSLDKVSPAGNIAGNIRISTDDTDQAVIQVPLYGTIQQ